MIFKNKNLFLKIYIPFVIVTIIALVVLQILGSKKRVGYLTDFNLEIDRTLELNNLNDIRKDFTVDVKLDEENIKNYLLTNENITNYVHHFRIRYYDKTFRNNDIYGVYPDLSNLPDYIKNAEMDEDGSPHGNFISDKREINEEKIDNINYKLKLKDYIITSILYLFILLFLILNIVLNIKFFMKILIIKGKKIKTIILNIKKLFYSDYFSIIFTAILCSMLIYALLPIVNKIPQIYNDFYIYSTIDFLEVIHELNFRMFLYPFSIIILIVIEFIRIKNNKFNLSYQSCKEYKYNILLLIIPILVLFIFTEIFDIFSFFIVISSIYIYMNYKEKAIYFPVLVFISMYFFKSLFIILNLLFEIKISIFSIYLLSFVFSIFSFNLLISDSNKKLIKFILLLQIFIPFNILMFTINKYNYRGEIIYFYNEHFKFQLIIWIIFLSLFIWNIILIFKSKVTSIKYSITLPTIISISIGNIYNKNILGFIGNVIPSVIIPNDWWHYADESMYWYQVFNLKQRLFEDISPISGLFSFVYSFFHNIILDGYISQANFAAILMDIVYIIIIAILLYKKTNSLFTFFIFHYFVDIFFGYSRNYLILPIMLLLSSQKLIDRKGFWIPIWIFCVFLYGLYYPSYGVGIMIASVPFGIIQLFLYINKKEYFKDIKNIYFYFVWLIVIASIIISAPLLLKILNWILLQAGQTKYVDGIRLFGQNSPSFFLPYIYSDYIKNNIFYIVRILIPIISELIVLHMFIKFIIKNKNNIAEKLNSSAFFIFTFFIIFIPFISFTTFIRQDVNILASRIGALLVPLLSVIIPMTVLFYCKNVFVNKYKYVMLSILFSIVILMRPPNFNYNSYVFSNIIDIPQDTELIDEELLKDFPILGKGFIPNNNKNELLSKGKLIKSIIHDDDSIFLDGYVWFLLANIIDRKIYITVSAALMKSTKFNEFALNKLNNKKPALFLGIPLFYPWLVKNEYKICPENDIIFLRPDRFEEFYGKAHPSNDISNSYYYQSYYNKAIAKSLGRSINKLEKYFTNQFSLIDNNLSNNNLPYLNVDNELEINFNKEISGNDFDYLYLELEPMKNILFNSITVYWGDYNEEYSKEKSITFDTEKINKYLIPIGMMNLWRFNKNSKLKIVFDNYNDKPLELKKLILYKRNIL
ncbi:hypothetical protein EPJ67_04625 [Brachyspira aalborgi]|uniref:Uncharacterized protein n=1 Tax=Brachyspira aalborgi TaxID=29522 RepID=A0A5C8G6C1_9SPIR|nr:hypothetical protein [Brachyspira aalborgi]TXJ57414.1 hypothetical protein EPJ67_04625 [Brachyspira aalborgi]